MRPRCTLKAAVSFLAVPTTAQWWTTNGPPQPPSHTAVYTTTATQSDSPHVTVDVIVTIIMPREIETWANLLPAEGYPVTGTAISHFSQPNSTTWSETNEVFWTVKWSSIGQSTPAPQPNAKSTLTAVYTVTSAKYTEQYGAWSAVWRNYTTTVVQTYVETVDANYPATIYRTGMTSLNVTGRGGVIGYSSTSDISVTASMVTTTTLLQVSTRPTLVKSGIFG